MTPLKDHISVDVRHFRSVRIDHDLYSKNNVFNGLVFHGTAQHTLNTLGKSYSQANHRVYTITGPYGTGKSTIALLLAGLLAPEEIIRVHARKAIGTKHTETFYQQFGAIQNGWFTIKIVCDFSSPIELLWEGLLKEASSRNILLSHIPQPNSPKELIDSYHAASKVICQSYDGIMILFDEMGKTLDFLNSTSGDLQFFQDFAEKVSRINERVIFVGFLHQSFADYAQKTTLKDSENWAKIHGRYNDIYFNVSEDETVSLISATIKQDSDYYPSKKIVENTVNALPGNSPFQHSLAFNKLLKCQPLHPLTAILLGSLAKKRFAQNERSIFGFLDSHEKFGFQDFLQNSLQKKLYTLDLIFNYLESNLDHLITSSPDGTLWTEAKELVQRMVAKLSSYAIGILKSIIIIELLGKRSSIYASKIILKSCFDGPATSATFNNCLAELVDAKAIIFRSHLNAYTIIEGSDVDIESEINDFYANSLDDNAWLERLQIYSDNIIAKQHYHETGALRWMQLKVETGVFEPKNYKCDSKGFSVFVVLLNNTAKNCSEKHPQYAFTDSKAVSKKLESALNEILALEHLNQHNPLVQHDKIAKKEIAIRLGILKIKLDRTIKDLFQQAKWWRNGETLPTTSLSEVASTFADELFHKSPPVLNELANRQKLSSAAAAARNKLLVAMVNHFDCENLNFEGYPPERAIYQSVLHNQGLHRCIQNNTFTFCMPVAEGKRSITTLFNDTLDWVKENNDRIITMHDIALRWEDRPYGVAKGLIPIWQLAFALACQDFLAFYDKDSTELFVFITDIDEEYADKMVKRPKDIGFKYYQTTGIRKTYVAALQKALAQKQSQESSTLHLARELVNFVLKLPQVVKVTKNLTSTTLNFREAILKANDPNALIFDEFTLLFNTDNEVELTKSIKECLLELSNKKVEIINGFYNHVQTLLGDNHSILSKKAIVVTGYTADNNLKTFAMRLSECEDKKQLSWCTSLLSFLSGKAEINWTDKSIEKAHAELARYAEKFDQAHYIATKFTSQGRSILNQDNYSKNSAKINDALSGLTTEEQIFVLKTKIESLIK